MTPTRRIDSDLDASANRIARSLGVDFTHVSAHRLPPSEGGANITITCATAAEAAVLVAACNSGLLPREIKSARLARREATAIVHIAA